MKLLPSIKNLFAPAPSRREPPALRTLTADTAIDELALFATLGRANDPDEALTRAGIGRERLRVLEYDDEIYAALETRREAVLSSDWRIEAQPDTGARGEDEALQAWLWVEPIMLDLLRAAWDAVPYGYSVAEMVWRQDGALIVPERAIGKPFEWFAPLPDGTLRYARRTLGLDHKVDTRFKFLLTRRAPSARQPYGEALLSRLYWPWFLRSEGWKMWARHLERHGSPTLVGRIEPPALDGAVCADDMQALQEHMERVLGELRDELSRAARAGTVATTAQIDAIAPSYAGQAFVLFNTEIAKRIQKVILGQTLTSDVQGGGSYAAAQVHDAVRQDKRNADQRMLRDTVQRLVDAVAVLNGWATRPVFSWTNAVDLQGERARRDVSLAQAGIVTFTDSYLLRAYDFEVGDFKVPDATITPSVALASATRFAAARDVFTPDQKEVEDVVEIAAGSAPPPVDPAMIRAAIRAARDPDDLHERLAQLLDRDDARFAEALAKAQFAASVLGYLHAEGGA